MGPVDVYLFKKREADAKIYFAGLLHAVVGFGFLLGELVTGKTENDEALIFVLLIKLFQPFELRGQSAFGGSVDDKEGLPFKFVHADGLSLGVVCGELVEFGGHM